MTTELIEEQSGQPDLQRYLDIVRRRYLYVLIPFFLGWLAVWGASWVLPAKYKSTTQILVEQPTMPTDYVAPNINENLQDRLQSIRQQILSRTRLALIIDKLHLYAGDKDDSNADARVDRMSKDIDIELVKDTRNNNINSFEVSYTASDPKTAQAVTTELTNLFIGENLKVRQKQSEGTTKFIEQQLEAARASLSEQEAKVRAFESAHEGVLPTQQQSNLQILSGLQSQLQNEQDTLNQSKQQRVYLQALIDQNRAARGALRGDGSPSGLAEVEQQLDRLRGELVDMSSRYTDQYPDVVKLKEQIARTERVRDQILAAPKKSTGESSSPSHDLDGVGPNSTLAQLQGQLKANQLEVSNREHRIDELQQRINEYQGRLNSAPAAEQQLTEITRGYEQSKADYDELLKKKNSSEMATSMEQMQQGERFTVLDPPSLPTKPSFPDHLKLCAMGLGAGLFLGVLVAGGFEFADDRLHSEKELKSLLPMAILSEIPEVSQPSDEVKRKRRLVLNWAVTVFVLAAVVTGATISFLNS
jgi:polysaccharide biosynthesis transport protein